MRVILIIMRMFEVRGCKINYKYTIAEKLGMNYVEQAGDKAFVGREIQEKKDGVERKVYYSSSSAFNIFKWSLKKCFEL